MVELFDADEAMARSAMQKIRRNSNSNALLIMYYSGGTIINQNGVAEWVWVTGESTPVTEINAFLVSVTAKSAVLFADASYGTTNFLK